ncbi:hydroxyacid dehydrogenase [Anaeromyxobacter diazotrophicus]|uniref:D-isomer specific 2-hydroxyacid dehydrogenase NAD-binding n=1 Tax=Anaeromyxobacter diazotrophicus TaxID=2590199 RepID=A0A7I9VL73_9BACT|nr:hydroxyacid dehydrogenase [Anaeromyxobacter diazotrophicus]GEJ57151.1 hypothetical protein AMYX_18920 [Anaeromyxobacter diazotrophicus]
MPELPRVVVTEFVAERAHQIFAGHAAVTADDGLWKDRARLEAELASAEALVVRNQTRVDAALLARAPRLRVVGRLGVGLDNIDLPACRARGIAVVVARGANAVAVAEHVLACLFAIARRVEAASRSVRAGEWDRRGFTGVELAGKTLGIVGLGDIGLRLARRAAALELEVLATSPDWPDAAAGLARRVPLDELLARSHFVSLHVPLTPATRGLIGAPQLARMRRDAWLVNTSRGEVVDEEALRAALARGAIAGAALDVRHREPTPAPDALAGLENVLLTPHVAGLTAEAQDRTAELVAEDVLRVLGGEPARYPA